MKEFFDPFFRPSEFGHEGLFDLPKGEADVIMATLGGKKFTGQRFRTIKFEVNGRTASFEGKAEFGSLEIQGCLGCGSSEKIVLMGEYAWHDRLNAPPARTPNDLLDSLEFGRIAIVVQLKSPNSVTVRYAPSMTFDDDHWTISP
ncbi:hypothetical protein A7J67_18535 [Achromobacter xylosoxidans]|nr:hypothetical protein A7J67_18535 [Achromobacter xylosoxidans]